MLILVETPIVSAAALSLLMTCPRCNMQHIAFFTITSREIYATKLQSQRCLPISEARQYTCRLEVAHSAIQQSLID
jgi:hypothetical protein